MPRMVTYRAALCRNNRVPAGEPSRGFAQTTPSTVVPRGRNAGPKRTRGGGGGRGSGFAHSGLRRRRRRFFQVTGAVPLVPRCRDSPVLPIGQPRISRYVPKV